MNYRPEDEVAREAAVKAAQDTEPLPDRITLSNGLVVKIKSVPPLLIRRAQTQIKKPEVPKFYNEEKGREEENPNHPRYLESLDEYNEQQNMAALRVLLLLGTEVVEYPDGMSRPEDSDWLDNLQALDIHVNIDSKPARYLAWLELIALSSIEDFLGLSNMVAMLSGISEGDVANAIESFRSPERSGANSELSSQENSENRDILQAASNGVSSRD